MAHTYHELKGKTHEVKGIDKAADRAAAGAREFACPGAGPSLHFRGRTY